MGFDRGLKWTMKMMGDLDNEVENKQCPTRTLWGHLRSWKIVQFAVRVVNSRLGSSLESDTNSNFFVDCLICNGVRGIML